MKLCRYTACWVFEVVEVELGVKILYAENVCHYIFCTFQICCKHCV